MAGTFKRGKLVVAYSPTFKRQTAFGSGLANSDLTAAMPLASLPTFRKVRREIRDCRGRIKNFEKDTELVEWTFDFPTVTPHFIFGWLCFLYGAVAAPTGTPADETQTLTIAGTGNFKLGFAFEGLTAQTENIPHTANAAAIQAALEKIRSIKTGNVSVTGTGPFTITFVNKLAKANVPLLTVDNTGMSGGTASIAAGTAGAQRVHLATRSTSDNLPLTSLAYGFEGDTTPPTKLINLGADNATLNLVRRGDVGMQLRFIGSAQKFPQVGFTLPGCTSFSQLKTEDCRLAVAGNFYADDLREASRTVSNNILTDADAYPFDSAQIQRIERQDESEFIPETISFNAFGSEGDALYTLGESETKSETRLLLGPPGDRCEIVSPETFLRLSDDPVQFVGTGNKSAIFIEGTPVAADSIGGAYSQVFGYLAQAAQFLSV